MPVDKTKLLPCPFCGRKAAYIFDDGAHWYKGVECKCGINIYFFYHGVNVASVGREGNVQEKIAIAKRWNRRANTKECARQRRTTGARVAMKHSARCA